MKKKLVVTITFTLVFFAIAAWKSYPRSFTAIRGKSEVVSFIATANVSDVKGVSIYTMGRVDSDDSSAKEILSLLDSANYLPTLSVIFPTDKSIRALGSGDGVTISFILEDGSSLNLVGIGKKIAVSKSGFKGTEVWDIYEDGIVDRILSIVKANSVTF